MTLKYESELLFDLMKRDGDDTPSDVLPYESELKEKYLNQVVGAYPKLQDYRPEWLNYNLYHHLPSDFPVESVANVTSASFQNVVPYVYKSAILKGNTLVNLLKVNKDNYIINNSQNWYVEDGYLKCISTTGWHSVTDKISSLIKSNTKYLIFVEIKENTLNIGINFDGYETVLNSVTTYLSFNSNEVGIKKAVITTPSTIDSTKNGLFRMPINIPNEGSILKFRVMAIEYQDGMENWDIPYFEGMQSVKMPVLTTSNEDGTKTNILTVNEDVTLRSNGSVCDELDLLTGKLTQRIDEDGEILTQEVVKTVDLTATDQDGNTESIIRPIEGTMHVSTSSQTLPPLLDMSVPVEATTQNLMSFANIEEGE